MAAQPMTNRWIGRIIVSTAAAAAVYLAIAVWAGRLQVISALRLVGVGTIAAVLTLSLLNYALRFLRWHFYLGTLGGNVPPLHDLRIYVGGFSGVFLAVPSISQTALGSLAARPGSATLMIRIATLWFAVLLGFVALAFRVGKPDQESDASTASPLPDSA